MNIPMYPGWMVVWPRTLQAAYDGLPAQGGTIIVAPVRYDVGGGLALTRGKPLRLYGSAR